MIGNIVGGPLDQTTVNQLKVRQEIAASGYGDSPIKRSPKVKNFLNNRTAWVKFASGVDIAGKYASEKIKNIFEGSGINIDTDDPATLGLLNENLAKRFILFFASFKILLELLRILSLYSSLSFFLLICSCKE